MKLVDNWKKIVRQAWSVKLAVVSALLSAAEFGVQYIAPEHASPKFAACAALLSLAAAVSRIVAQPKLWK